MITRKVIKEKFINGQHCLIVLKSKGGQGSHYEYYVGIPQNHPSFEKSPTSSKRWWKEPLRTEYVNIRKSFVISNNDKLRRAIKTLNPPINFDKIKLEKVYAIQHAWLSYIGNSYDYLKEDYCYYGGGMYLRSFGEEDCYISAEIAMRLISRKLSEICNLDYKLEIRFEGD